MITETEPNIWIVTSETELNIKYLIEKCNVICDNCILRCDSCNICVHTFKCSFIDNVLYFILIPVNIYMQFPNLMLS